MLANLALDVVVVLLGCAIVLGLIALYYRHMDASAIDQEVEREVREESPEERAEVLRKQAKREERAEVSDLDGYSDSL